MEIATIFLGHSLRADSFPGVGAAPIKRLERVEGVGFELDASGSALMNINVAKNGHGRTRCKRVGHSDPVRVTAVEVPVLVVLVVFNHEPAGGSFDFWMLLSCRDRFQRSRDDGGWRR